MLSMASMQQQQHIPMQSQQGPMPGVGLQQQHVVQQQQGQGQQGQQVQQQHVQNQPGQPGQPFVPPPPPSGQDWTLSSVLHYLQSEWRRYERDRNEWEIERAESRARIALLEGERRSFENVKSDFMRRIKMLEYALRVERAKNVEQIKGKTPGPGGASSSSAKGHKSSSKDDTAAGGEAGRNGSAGSSPKSEPLELVEPAPLQNGVLPTSHTHTGAPMKSASPAPPNFPTSATYAGVGRPPLGRDPKSRARSREYLKQCLQEITYLTSPQAANPLPNRPFASAPNLPVSMPNLPSLSVNDYSTGVQGQGQQLQQQQYHQPQPQHAPQQIQLLPQPQVQPAAPPSHFGQPQPTNQGQQQATIQISNASAGGARDTGTTMARPRKVVPDVVNVFPQPPSGDASDQPQVFPSTEDTSDIAGAEITIMSDPPRQHDEEEDLQAVEPMMTDDVEVLDAQSDSVPSSSEPTPAGSTSIPESTSTTSDYSTTSQSSSASSADSMSDADSASEPGTPASVINLSLAPEGDDQEYGGMPGPFTAIFRPDDKGAWKEKLRAAHEEELARREAAIQQDPENLLTGGIHLGANLLEDEDVSAPNAVEEAAGPVWKVKRALRSHLDAVRVVSFHPNELSLATGSDDNTIKIWKLDTGSLSSNSSRQTIEQEPLTTLRAHTAPITAITYSPARRLLYSTSLDSTIRVWALPPAGKTTYSPFDTTSGVPLAVLVGHAEAVWDSVLVKDESVLVSCGADGKVKVWDVSPAALAAPPKTGADGEAPGPAIGSGKLLLSWGYDGTGEPAAKDEKLSEDVLGATSMTAIRTDLRKVAVAYRNAVVKIFDVETGEETARLASDVSYDGTPQTIVNKIVSHPTIPLLVTGHEDRFIRIFDLTTGQCTHSMPAHLDGVTSLSIDPSGFTLVSSSHDCSIRFWDLLKTRACIQELSGHRKKSDEGVLDVAFHPAGLPFLASAGADGVVRIYGSAA
ncbi:WD40 repeat-like protein [Clavulina sp. PMI_390]|nr:WD40 repeat-like protein [Clavulina sp. PMI_390]